MVRRLRELFRLELVRQERAATHLSTFVVASVATILVTRAFLAITGYPRIGGDSALHVAHVLPGGLLMLVAIVLLLGYIGPGPGPAGAVVGGVGFGLFIDEVGKFVTADNDYFFGPTAAIIYVVFVALVISSRRWRSDRPLTPAERAANIAVVAAEGLAGRLSRARREEALAQLRAVRDEVPGADALERLLLAVPERPVPLPARVERAGRWVAHLLHRVATSPAALPAMALLLVGQALASSAVAVALWNRTGTATLPLVGVLVGTAASLVFTVRGLLHLGEGGHGARDPGSDGRLRAVESFRRSALTSLLLTQVFLFAVSQFSAVGGLAIDLALLGLVNADLARMRHERADEARAGHGLARGGHGTRARD